MISNSLLVADVSPERLARARENVVHLHPGTATAPTALPSEGLAALRTRVGAAANDPKSLYDLALQLSPREVRSLVRGLELWDELRGPTASILWQRRKQPHLSALWKSWQFFPSVPEIRDLLRQFGEEWEWEGVANEPRHEPVREWVTSEEPGLTIQQWLDENELSASDLVDLDDPSLIAETPLELSVRAAVLTDGSAQQLRREGIPRLHIWSSQISPENHLRFGQNFLTKLPIDPAHRELLAEFVDRYGLPRRPIIPRFWDGIPEDAKAAIQRLFIRKRIKDFFHADKDRRDYWIQWENNLFDVERNVAQGVEYGFLDFGTFGVIEFFENGHAAHFYSEERFQRLMSRRITELKQLRERYYPGISFGVDNRLIHSNPPGGWYRKATMMVNQWLQATSK